MELRPEHPPATSHTTQLTVMQTQAISEQSGIHKVQASSQVTDHQPATCLANINTIMTDVAVWSNQNQALAAFKHYYFNAASSHR